MNIRFEYIMKIHIQKNVLKLLYIAVLFLASCSQNSLPYKKFEWEDDIVQLTGKDLTQWLRKAPFSNELKSNKEGEFLITNAEQVFPFMGRYYSAIEELRKDLSNDTVIYQNKNMIFQDQVLGDMFLSATLLYENQEVFLSESYAEFGNPFFAGAGAVTDTYSASLYETDILAQKPNYKTGMYWASANFKSYLLGFYQKGKLILEAAIPLLGTDSTAALSKLKEVNKMLNLNIPEWEQATVNQLNVVQQPKSFWKDPYQGFYLNEYLLDDVYLKFKDTPFVEATSPIKGDHYFSYTSPKGLVELYFALQKTDKNEVDFNKENDKLQTYQFNYQQVFFKEESSGGEQIGIAKTYYKNNQFLELHYRYPESDKEAQKEVHEILKYIKVNRF